MQVDHSSVAGMLASLWPGLEPRESVLTAAALHDIGWRSWEACPRLDAGTGRPQNFLAVDINLHLEFYEAGIAEVTARDRYAGMLVGKHLAGIYRRRYGTQDALKHDPRRRRPRPRSTSSSGGSRSASLALQRELGVSDEEFWRNYVLLQVFDRLSLWLCKGDPAGTGSMQIVAARRRRAQRHADGERLRAQSVSARGQAGADLRARAGRAADRLRATTPTAPRGSSRRRSSSACTRSTRPRPSRPCCSPRSPRPWASSSRSCGPRP